MELNNELQNLKTRNSNIFNYNCNKKEDRIKINKLNNYYIKYFKNYDIKHKLSKFNFHNFILNDSFVNNFLNVNTNYIHYSIYVNPHFDLKYKNCIYIFNNDNPVLFNELIFNKHYKIFGSNFHYKYKRKLDLKNINQIQFIIFYNHIELNNELNNIFLKKLIFESRNSNSNSNSNSNIHNLQNFLNNKIILLQIGIPEFHFPDTLKKHYNSWDIPEIWNVKLNEFLCYNFVKNNFNHHINICLNMIYSVTSKTDLIRHLFLYKYGGLYMDISVKLLDTSFLKLLKTYNFISGYEKKNKKILLNGILYFKQKQNDISKLFIKEIVSGVFNENLSKNNSLSFIFNNKPSKNCFFYGPNTLYNIFKKLELDVELKEKKDVLLLTCNIVKKKVVKINNKTITEFKCFVEKEKVTYLQVKYIGYYQDLYYSNMNNYYLNDHYTINYNNKKYYYSPLEYIDKILIINLKHRTDRKKEMLKQINRLNLSIHKFEFIEAIYDKQNGALGCTKSHLKCLNYALENNLNNVCIIEDDYDFIKDIQLFNQKLLNFFIKIENWDVLLLYMSNHGPPINIQTNFNNIYENYWSQSTACYILNKSIFQEFKSNCEYIIQINNGNGPIDFYWNYLKNKYKWYFISDLNGCQRKSYSDIEKCIVEYK